SSPNENLHTILYRIKEKKRLIEKIDEENRQLGVGAKPITQKNFQERIDDLLGIRGLEELRAILRRGKKCSR
ncbi:MAG: hypothetical protein KKE12_02810, partial [Proteobacteria bacterium]|nr:hypothetical protein [Pseudomonadota bacterium]